MRSVMAGCWKMGGGSHSPEKETNNNHKNHHFVQNHFDDQSASNNLDIGVPRQPIRPQRVSTVSLSLTGTPKSRRQRKRSGARKPRKHSDGTGLFPAGFEDDDDDEDDIIGDLHLHNEAYSRNQPSTSTAAPAAVPDLKKTKIKKILLCGRGLRHDIGKGKCMF